MTALMKSEVPGALARLLIGSRGSPLALAQARWVEAALSGVVDGIQPRVYVIQTHGDRFQSALLSSGATVGIFVREIEEALRSGQIDLAVHSLKDLPTAQPPGLTLAAIPAREDPRDVLVVREGGGLEQLARGARVGTGSPRRIGQLRALRTDLQFEAIRGNVDTRLRKLREGHVDALILAAAGLKRIGAGGAVFHPLPFEKMLPAPGQGALGLEVRSGDADLARILARRLNHRETRAAVQAERAFLKALGGGCQMPVGALGTVEGDELRLEGVVAAPDGARLLRDEMTGSVSDPEALGHRLGEKMLSAGAGDLLASTTAGGSPR